VSPRWSPTRIWFVSTLTATWRTTHAPLADSHPRDAKEVVIYRNSKSVVSLFGKCQA